MRRLSTSIGAALLLVLIVGCTPTVSLEDLYRSDVTALKSGSARNIAVEQTADGMKITGSEISVLALITTSSFKLKTEPQDAELKYTIGQMKLDSGSGALILEANLILGEDSTVPALLPMKGAAFFAPKAYGFAPGAPGSQNVTVKINPATGHTHVAGLAFNQEVVLNIWEDGTVEVNKAGIVASDKDGNEWISKKAKVGDKIAIVLIKKA